MNNWNKSLMAIFILLIFASVASGQTALEIIEKADKKMQGTSSKTEMIMRIVRPDWTREIGIKGWALDKEYSLMLITSPARDKGSAFLKRESEIWNWQPSIDRVIKLPPSMMMQSWMGSDFTNDDLVKESSIVRDYSHTLEGDTTINGRDAWKIVLIPNEDAAVVWGKIEAYITKEDYLQLLFRYYDEDDFLVNTMILSDIKEMGGRTIPTRLEIIPAENPDQKTEIIYKSMEFDIDINSNFFSIQNMKRVR
ncbi:MAG: outer membrane lipoprotein-sorting protein [Bacteroidetes bacterium]|nr:outer membrane lipoprotein-sorting protein [Bacteroidota bacterium]MCH8233268.1 outer membrane lipoprotein-sorting protein [Bacteroidota bacterium]MCH8319249.1 outer membrane lipoprotein-sorting protein [Bacteroidota bacterium]